MVLSESVPIVAEYGVLESVIVIAAVVAVVGYGLWVGTRDPRVPRNARRDELIIGFGLAAIGLACAVLTGLRVSWHVDALVAFGRLGTSAVPAAVPFAITLFAGLAALVGTIVGPAFRRRYPRVPVIRPSRRGRAQG